MNRETRRMIEREERLQKNKDKGEKKGAAARAAARASAAAPTADKKPFFRRIADYLHEVRVEMRKVSWPTGEQMIVFTAVTLITSVALTLLIFGLDFGLKNAVLWIIEGGISG